MADEISPVSEVSSSSSSSSTQSTSSTNNTQSTSESSSSSSTSSTSSTSETSSSSSSTSSTEKSHEIDTNDSTSISNEASAEADEADDGSQLNMSWITGDADAYEEAAIGKSTQKANEFSGEISVDYARQFMGEQTCFINKDGENLLGLQRQCTDKNDVNYSDYKTNNCANFVSSVLVATGRTDEHINTVKGLKDDLLNNEGYKLVSADEAQAGDVWMHIGSDYRHVEIVTGRDENGNITTIGSNNIYDANGNNTHEQAVSERSKTESQVTGSNNFILHKDFTADELKNISETLENNSIYDTAAEKVAGAEVSAEASPSALETMSDISALTSELDKIDDVKAGNYQSLSGYQSGNVTEQLKEKASKLDSTDNPVAESVKEATNEKVEEAEKKVETASTSGVPAENTMVKEEAGTVNGTEAVKGVEATSQEGKAVQGNSGVNGAGLDYTGSDKEIADFINQYFEDKASPAAGSGVGEMMVQYGKENDVDPLILVAIAQGETSLGTKGIGMNGMLGVGAYDDDPNNAVNNPAFSGIENQIKVGAETFSKLREQAGLTSEDSLHDQLKGVNEQGWATATDWYDLIERCYTPTANKAIKAGIAQELGTVPETSGVEDATKVNEAVSTSGVPAENTMVKEEAGNEAIATSGVPAENTMIKEESVNKTEETSAVQETGKLKGDTPKEQIANYLKDEWGLSDTAVAGVMGNMGHESGFLSNNLWNEVDQIFGGDQAYTDAVDNGIISREQFTTDSYPYGIVQFKSQNYKEGLYDLAKGRGVSVSDLETQLDYLSTQVGSDLREQLNNAGSIEEATKIFAAGFVKCTAGMSDREKQAREAYLQIINS